MPNALILGIDGALGAYLARLLQARGVAVYGTSAGDGDALSALGIASEVTMVDAADASQVATGMGDATVFAIADASDDQTALVKDVFGQASAAATPPRLCHVVDHAALRMPGLKAQARQLIALREAGHHAVNAILHSHDSRLGSPASMPARIAVAARDAARGDGNGWLEIAELGPRDWGWTPEYVDAIQRLAALPRPQDLAIGSGQLLTTADVVREAFAYFKADASRHVRLYDDPASPEPGVDTAKLRAATGWSATTWGRDLVRTLCEGAGGR